MVVPRRVGRGAAERSRATSVTDTATSNAVADAAAEMGIPRVADFNTGDNEGIGLFHVNQRRGRRWSAARGFLKPVLNRPNLRLETDVLVDRLMWLANSSPNGQVRAIASYKLSKLATRAKSAVNKTELDTAQRQLLAVPPPAGASPALIPRATRARACSPATASAPLSAVASAPAVVAPALVGPA